MKNLLNNLSNLLEIYLSDDSLKDTKAEKKRNMIEI